MIMKSGIMLSVCLIVRMVDFVEMKKVGLPKDCQNTMNCFDMRLQKVSAFLQSAISLK